MRTKIPFVILLIFCLSFFSCIVIEVEDSAHTGEGQGSFPASPSYRTFKVVNLVNQSYYDAPAELLYEGARCRVWGEISAKVDPYTARNVANVYDKSIYPRMINAFSSGEKFYDGKNVVANNPIEYASWLTDGDGKLTIFLVDIIDGYSKNTGFVGGYFSAIDLFSRSRYPNSNEEAMIYIDTFPGQPGNDQSNGFLAHELQHLMNLAISIAKRSDRDINGNIRSIRTMDVWIDEGLATSSEWIWSGIHVSERVEWFNYDEAGTIARGNNFFVWDNHTANPLSILDEYSTAYLFFQWLRLQAGGGTGIYKNIINSPYSNYRAVTSAANSAVPGQGYSDWGTLLKTWLAANYINAPSGKYGYRNDSTMRAVKAGTVPSGIRNVNLYPGEGVYSVTYPNLSWPAQGENIRYAGLTENTPWLSDNSIFSSGVLLTYNANINFRDIPERGSTTGVSASLNVNPGRLSRTALTTPYAIGAGDLLRRNGYEMETINNMIRYNAGSMDFD